MKAIVFNGPWRIDIEDRPKPTCVEPTDAIVKVSLAGICGSELHMYRGYQKTEPGHIMVFYSAIVQAKDCNSCAQGHEFTGILDTVGANVKNMKQGQRVVTTFSAVW